MVMADKLFIVIQFDVKDRPDDVFGLAVIVHDWYIFQRQMGAYFPKAAFYKS